MENPKASRPTTAHAGSSGAEVSLSHLRREVRTALELAVVALAPPELMAQLANSAGMLEALVELPPNSPPALALVPGLVERARASLDQWQKWHHENLENKMPRG